MLLLEDGTLVRGLVICPLSLLYVVLAVFAHVRLVSALFNVVDPDLDAERLLAVLTLLRTHLARRFMVPECGCRGRVSTVLALNRLVSRLFMLLAVRFRHDVAALAALVVLAGAPNLVHPNLADTDGSLARRTNLRLFLHCLRHH